MFYITFRLLSAHSISYNNWLTKKEFKKMCNYIENAKIDYINLVINGCVGAIDTDSINNIGDLADDLTYSKSAPKTSYSTDKNKFIGFEIHFFNKGSIAFGTENSTDLKVSYNQKSFIVKSKILTDFINSDEFKQIQANRNSTKENSGWLVFNLHQLLEKTSQKIYDASFFSSATVSASFSIFSTNIP